MAQELAQFIAWLERHPRSYTLLSLAALGLLAWLAIWLTRHILLRGLRRLVSFTTLARDPDLSPLKVIDRLAHIVPALVLNLGIKLVPDLPAPLVTVVENVCGAVILHTLALALAAKGAQVEEAADGEEAWERFQQAPFDAVVSDHVMPRCTGLELLERLRARDPRLPVVLASGCYPEGVERRLAADPWLRLLPKPFGMARLARLLAEMALHHR